MSNVEIKQRAIEKDEGHMVKHPTGADMNIKVFASETGGAYSLMETVLPPGGVVPLHVHEAEDENNYILEGKLTMVIGDRTYAGGPGTYVVAPRGVTQHFINNEMVPCRFLTMFTPGGAEGFFREAGEIILKAAPSKPDPEEIARLQEKYRLTYL